MGAPSALLNLSERREKPGFQLNSTISEGYVWLGLCASLSFWIVRTYYHLTHAESLHVGKGGFKPGLKHTLWRGEDQEGVLPCKEGSGGRTQFCPSQVVGQTSVLQARHYVSHGPRGSSDASGFLQHPRANTLSCNSIPEIPNDREDHISHQNWTHASSSRIEIPHSATAQALALLPHL